MHPTAKRSRWWQPSVILLRLCQSSPGGGGGVENIIIFLQGICDLAMVMPLVRGTTGPSRILLDLFPGLSQKTGVTQGVRSWGRN